MKLWNGDKVPEISRLGSIRRAAPYVECNIEDNIHLCPLSVIFALTPKIDDGSRRQHISDIPAWTWFEVGDAVGVL